ncbi:MAG: selenocysteine-specific translation elongation factor [Burkholderiales bacterium]
MIVATAGHIDHGKSTLVKALSGIDTDRLPEEKARGISIDLGFAYWTPPDAPQIGFVDVPGHERFVRNMLAGVCGIDFVMLVVAADDGVMPQTIEHLNIIDLLGVTAGIAIVTKTDRVGADRVAEVIESTRALLAPTSLAAIDVIAASAHTGDGIAKLRDVLATASRNLQARDSAGRQLRYAIDRAFTITGSGTVVTGTVFNHEIRVGDRVTVTPRGVSVRVRGIQKNGVPSDSASAGERCAINIAGASLEEVGRGDWIVANPLHAPTERLDARVSVLAAEERALGHWTPVRLHLGTSEVIARVSIRRGESIEPGGSRIVQLLLDRPIAALQGDRFILRDQSATRTIGGGTVVDPFAPRPRRRDPLRAERLDALATPDPQAALARLFACSPAGVEITKFGCAFNLTEARLQEILAAAGALVVSKDPDIALLRAGIEAHHKKILHCLQSFHTDQPRSLGLGLRELRAKSAPALDEKTFLALLRVLAEAKKLSITGSIATLAGHHATANSVDDVMWQKLKPLLVAMEFKPEPAETLAVTAGLKKAIVEEFLHRKAKSGEVFRVSSNRFYPRETFARLAAIAQSVAQASADQMFTAAQYRDQVGVNRMLSIEILESLDRLGITQRIGDKRKIRKDFATILGPVPGPTNL